ncbi:MAG: GIY-YIG nuclease family protein [Terriglobia bacterium]
MAFLYILQSESTRRFYIGSTTDLERRLAEHARAQTPSAAKRGPWRLVYREVFPTLSAARQRERRLKAWKSHQAIAKLVAAESSGG